jgi:hypothetical protein
LHAEEEAKRRKQEAEERARVAAAQHARTVGIPKRPVIKKTIGK